MGAHRVGAKWCGLAEFGAFGGNLPGTDGLLHISEIAEQRIRDVRDELKIGRPGARSNARHRGQ